jgi:hypothetical protein
MMPVTNFMAKHSHYFLFRQIFNQIVVNDDYFVLSQTEVLGSVLVVLAVHFDLNLSQGKASFYC